MKKVLYISNIEVPYRTEYFNQLSKEVDLTVLYERKKSSNRDDNWTNSVERNFKTKYLKGFKFKNEYSFDLRIIKYAFTKKYDQIIIGCYNSPSQMILIFLMKLFRRKYILNLDGEIFVSNKSFKNRIKLFFIKGAKKYLIAGHESAINLSKFVKKEKIYPYNFSSLTSNEVINNSKEININNNKYIIVVGQYFDYKGLDVALEVAKKDKYNNYKFIGSGNRSELLKEKAKSMNISNIEIIPFLQKNDLFNEYKNCKALFLPTNQECWGLVVNEAASFGCPIVSTYGSGAACEFLKEKYSCFLAQPGNVDEMIKCIKQLDCINLEQYKKDLLHKSSTYSIEENVNITLSVINGE